MLKRVLRTKALQTQRGAALLDSVMAVALMAIIVVVMATALVTHSISARSIDSNAQALNLVRTQLEDIRAASYATSYSVTVTMPSAEYSMAISVSTVITNLQQVTVTLTRSGSTYLSLSMYKSDTS